MIMGNSQQIAQIIDRYTVESSKNCNLSCGSNLDHLDLLAGESILDLGCGKGRETMMAAKLVGPAGRATGLDITQAMIAVALAQSKIAEVENAEFVQGEIENLPFMEDTFDAVMSNCVINHARSKPAVFAEIYRVLKPGGRFVISDAVTRHPLPDTVKSDPQAWAECYGGAITKEEYLAGIENAGFTQIQILSQREYVKNSYDFISLIIIGYKNSK